MAGATGWEGILEDGEQILWQGRPRFGLSVGEVQPMRIAMGVLFMGFSVFWIGMAESMTRNSPFGGGMRLFPLFGIPFFLIGAWNAFGSVLWRAFMFSRTHYSLSNRRAFVATDMPGRGRMLKSYPILPDSILDLDDRTPGTVWFDTRYRDDGTGQRKIRIGFERIDDARRVHALLRQVQKGTA